MPGPDLLHHELPYVEQLIREAGARVRALYEAGTDVSWKGVNDPVTAADRAANEYLVQGLRSEFPQDGILAEESVDDLARLDRPRVWIVDPLDGTREFIGRILEFSVMVGLCAQGRPVLGLVYQPIQDMLLRGIPGRLADLVQADESRPLAVSRVSYPADMRLVVSRSHRNPLVNSVSQHLHIDKDRPSGSVGIKVGLLATAACDLYIHPAPGLKEWDTCAPDAILHAAGGMITDAWGRRLTYNKPDVRQRWGLVASNGKAHDQVVAATSKAAEAAGYSPEGGFW